MGFVFSCAGLGVICMSLAMSIDAYQVEFDSDVDVGPWGKYLWPVIIASTFGITLIVEGLRMGFPT